MKKTEIKKSKEATVITIPNKLYLNKIKNKIYVFCEDTGVVCYLNKNKQLFVSKQNFPSCSDAKNWIENNKMVRSLFKEKNFSSTMKHIRKIHTTKIKKGKCKKILFEAQKGLCSKCGQKLEITNKQTYYQATIDHIIPFSKGGTFDISNLQLLCNPCNLIKDNK